MRNPIVKPVPRSGSALPEAGRRADLEPANGRRKAEALVLHPRRFATGAAAYSPGDVPAIAAAILRTRRRTGAATEAGSLASISGPAST